jgi:amidophosphoribosyltransferase
MVTADKFKDACGVFGVHGDPESVAATLRALEALQHRGQESAGVAYSHDGRIVCTKAMGSVRDLARCVGPAPASVAIGHVRYGTCGDRSIAGAQPFVCGDAGRELALAHNGHIKDLTGGTGGIEGAQSGTVTDSEMLARRVARHYTGDAARAVQMAFDGVPPAYSVVIMTADSLCCVRDPLGMRPLSLGRKGGATVMSSESCAFDAIDAELVRDVRPGEMVIARNGTVESFQLSGAGQTSAQCIFELIYFARPDSTVFGHNVAEFRIRLGERLALEAPASADLVVPVPDSAMYGGLGYARVSGLELSMALFRTHGVGRTFIEPSQASRAAALLAKLYPIAKLLTGRRVVLIDDSIVRGNVCRYVVRRLRDAGAREVHVRVTSPPTIASCHFGVDTPDERELFANGRDLSSMRDELGADSLQFLSLEALYATARPVSGFCTSCFTGVDPIAVATARTWPLRAVASPSAPATA